MVHSMDLRVYSFYLIVQDGQQFLGRANGVVDCAGDFPSRFVVLTADGQCVASGENVQDGQFSVGAVKRLLEEKEVEQILAGSEVAQKDFKLPTQMMLAH